MVDTLESLDKLKNLSNNFRERLFGLESVYNNKCGKIGIHNNKIYVSSYWFQRLERIIYNEDRKKSIEHLTKIINEYIIFFNLINDYVVKFNNDNFHKLKIINIQLINKWYTGIGYLQKEYIKDYAIQKKLDNIKDKLYFLVENENKSILY